jgi:hypothetical protein
MPVRRKIDRLPAGIRAWLHDELAARGFADHAALADELNRRLAEQAEAIGAEPETVSPVTVWRESDRVRRRVERIQAATQAAELIQRAHPDEADAMSGAVIAMVQNDTFDVLLQLQEADEDTEPGERLALLSKAARAIAELSHASIRHKQHAARVRAALESAKAAAAAGAEQVARRAGLSDSDWGLIRAQILGIEVRA